MQGQSWLSIKRDLLNKWSKLSDDKLERTHGRQSAVADLIAKNYEGDKSEILGDVNAIYDQYGLKGENT